MIEIKNRSVLGELLAVRFHPKLVDLVGWCSARWPEFCITSGFRKGDPGVHGQNPCRGLDVRSSWSQTPKAVADEVNSEWIYDPGRPEMRCCIYHDIGRGPHFHLQVHPNTVHN